MEKYYGILSLLPPLLAVILSILTKNVILSLFIGVFSGVLVMAGGNPIITIQSVIGDYFFMQLQDSYNAGVLVLLVFIGGFVALMEQSGGARAFAESVSAFINTKRKGQIAAWIGGVIIFFSDLGTPLIVGPIFEPLFDKLKLSREKLAWILDSTASPVAVLIPFIGWGVYSMGLIQKEFETLSVGLTDMQAFVGAIPFQFYSILSVIMVPLIAVTGFDFSAMEKAEKRTEKGEIFSPGSKPMGQTEKMKEVKQLKTNVLFVSLPIFVLLATLCCFIIHSVVTTGNFPAGSAYRVALSTSYLFSALTLIILMVVYKYKKFTEAFDIYIQGMKNMVTVSIILVLSWSLGAVMKELGTSNYIVELARESLPFYLVPALIFLIGSCISFATGSSWGTFAIMMPIAIPMAVNLQASLIVSIGAVLSGGLFGDHCTPISDTTILSSTGAGADHVDHVKTQLPYALLNAAISLLMYLVAGFSTGIWNLVLAIVIQVFALFILRKRTR